MASIKAFFSSLISDEKSNPHKLLNVFLTVGGLVGMLAFIVTAIIEPTFFSLLVVGVIVFICFVGLFIANILKKPVLSAIIINIVLNLGLFPIMYFTSGGLKSGCPVWMLIGLILSFSTVPGRIFPIIVFCVSLIGPVGSIVIEYLHPEYVVNLSTDLAIIVDLLTAIILVSITFGAMFKYQALIYEKQKRQIGEAADMAKAATKAKTNFLSNMTHDIRTPMNAIIGFTEIARKNANNRTTLLSSLSNISTASEHLLALVNDVLEMSHIESGRLELQNEPTTITSIIDKVETIMRPEMEDVNIHFVVDTSCVIDDCINADELRLTQILINVLSNAVKYSNPDGYIYLTVEQRQSPALDTIMCEIRVRDEGIGMSQDFIPHVFEPFTREKTTTVSGIPGSGLGLSITKTLLEFMHGSISVTSEVNKGTEFVIRIPFEVPTLSEIDTEEVLQFYDFKNKRVLIVEDNDLNCEITKEILMDVGFEVDTARDGTFAVDKLKHATPGYYDIILMDLQMPLMSGFEATEIIRNMENQEIAQLPIVALTANAFNSDKEKVLNSGMNAFVTKPINAVNLLNTIQEMLRQ